MPRMDVGAYLSRIGYQGPTEPTLETLRGLHRCHLFSVPFESLSVHCGEPITLVLPLLYHKIVRRRRGGFCYENNGLFLWLLRALGFCVVGLAGRVRNRFTGRLGPPRDHLVLLAQLQGQRFLCDVGFGDGFLEPLRLELGLEQPQEGGIFRLGLAGGVWALERLRAPGEEGRMLYTFTLEPRELGDFAAMCCYHQHAPSSIFACKSFCSLPQPGGGRLTYMGWRLIATRGGERTETPLQPPEIPALLQHAFGVQLSRTLVPKDQDIQPPPEGEEMGPAPPH
ncbi:arylamine N-acetyltransferase, pineal gland isozyme NAT-10-like isoform X1 [Dermochelys coriacea]|uniref:arylamine N-acetyltransferase, pineal gland isozyme NAT-10-like isoform X1 n=2 Tax=Dermochelys coriacea TaxID=27794 RepID=UPI001CA9E6B8|nr:arylamine N-acetyltransferase, pineal gland isozyme NAT-10-like isoform X1 [Dermochelys coriacea]